MFLNFSAIVGVIHIPPKSGLEGLLVITTARAYIDKFDAQFFPHFVRAK